MQRNLRTRSLTVVGRRRTVTLIAADLSEAQTWAHVLSHAAALDPHEHASLLHDATTDAAATFPTLFPDLAGLIDTFVPLADAFAPLVTQPTRSSDEEAPAEIRRGYSRYSRYGRYGQMASTASRRRASSRSSTRSSSRHSRYGRMASRWPELRMRISRDSPPPLSCLDPD